MTTKKVDHGGVIGQLAESENTIMELQETIENLNTPSHTMREGIYQEEMSTTLIYL